jgi:hypothetical protein
MPWGTTVDDNHKIDHGTHVVTETQTFVNARTGTVVGALTRRNLLVTTRWTGLEGSTAGSYVNANRATAGIEDLHSERENDAGAYAVIQSSIELGTWDS